LSDRLGALPVATPSTRIRQPFAAVHIAAPFGVERVRRRAFQSRAGETRYRARNADPQACRGLIDRKIVLDSRGACADLAEDQRLAKYRTDSASDMDPASLLKL
jgi:hypothetical protein